MKTQVTMIAKESIEQRLKHLEKKQGVLTVDADTHLSDPEQYGNAHRNQMQESPDYYHGRPISLEDLLREMDLADIDMSLAWQNPSVTPYPGDPEGNFRSLLEANRYIHRCSLEKPERIIPAGWTDPRALGTEKAKELATACVRQMGFTIVKLNPAQNQFPIDSKEVVDCSRHIIGLGAVPAYHFGSDTPYTPPEGLEKLARELAPSPLIAIHMAGGGAGYVEADENYRLARELGLRNPNICYVLSAKRDTHMESDLISYALAGNPFSGNLCCASDAPYGRQSWNFGGFRAMFKGLKQGGKHTDRRLRETPTLFTDELIRGFMGGNLAALAIESCRNVLEAWPE